MKKQELQHLIEASLVNQFKRGQLSRRQFMQTMIMAGMGLSGVNALAARPFRQDRPLTPTFYQWIVTNHPEVNTVNQNFPNLDAQIAPVEGFDVARFVAEGQNQESTWDVYVGMTPFVEMAALIAAMSSNRGITTFPRTCSMTSSHLSARNARWMASCTHGRFCWT
jgi:hypothetical protein